MKTLTVNLFWDTWATFCPMMQCKIDIINKRFVTVNTNIRFHRKMNVDMIHQKEHVACDKRAFNASQWTC